MKNFNLLILLFTFLLASCKGGEPITPYTYESNPHYAWGYAEFYGAYYSEYGIKNNTLSLSLFSDSLKLTNNNELVGYGQYLFLEDIFIAPTDTLIRLGTYRISISEKGDPFTFYAGKKDTIDSEVYTTGAYITYYEQNSDKSTIKLITGGSFTVSLYDNKPRIICNFTTDDKLLLKGSFTGELPHFDQSLTPKKIATRNRFWFR